LLKQLEQENRRSWFGEKTPGPKTNLDVGVNACEMLTEIGTIQEEVTSFELGNHHMYRCLASSVFRYGVLKLGSPGGLDEPPECRSAPSTKIDVSILCTNNASWGRE
jgi:hypothetical protein